MELTYDQTMTANVPAVDHDNAPAIEIGDVLTVQISKHFEVQGLKTGDWVLVRNPEIRHGCYILRQYWPVEDGALLVAGNPSIPAHRVTRQDAIDGVVLEIRKARPQQVVEN